MLRCASSVLPPTCGVRITLGNVCSGNVKGADVDLDAAKCDVTMRTMTFGPYRFGFHRAAGIDTITVKAPKEDVRYELVLGPAGKQSG